MAIDQDKDTYWLSEPDGATPKWLSVDMKDLKPVSRVTISSPDAKLQSPVRGELRGSHDGKFWFRIASQPPLPASENLPGEFGPMSVRVYSGDFTGVTGSLWSHLVDLVKNGKPVEQANVEQLNWKLAPDSPDAAKPFAVIWQGKLVQAKSGAAHRRRRKPDRADARRQPGTAHRRREPHRRCLVGQGPARSHRLFGDHPGPTRRAVSWAKAEATGGDQVVLQPFRAIDFDLERPEAKIEPVKPEAPAPEKDIQLAIDAAKLTKKTEQFGVSADFGGPHIGNWKSVEDVAMWDFEAPEAGVYDVLMNYAHAGDGGQFRLELGKQVIQGSVLNTGAWEKYVPVNVGSVLIGKAGSYSLSLKALDIKGDIAMHLAGITLRPAVGSRTIVAGGTWAFRFPTLELRHVKFVVQEYRGEAVAVNRIEIGGDKPGEVYIPTKTDVLSLAGNDTLEIAAGDTITVTYTDELTQTAGDRSQLLSGTLAATYFNGSVRSIDYDFFRRANGYVETVPKLLMRIDPGERFVVEITDYDRDTTAEPDQVKFQVQVNDGDPIEMVAQETKPYSGEFTKEVDTSATAEGDKLVVKPGDRIVCRYMDEQNTFPGHSVRVRRWSMRTVRRPGNCGSSRRGWWRLPRGAPRRRKSFTCRRPPAKTSTTSHSRRR